METFTCIGDVTPSIGIRGLTSQHILSIQSLLAHTVVPAKVPNSVRHDYAQAVANTQTVSPDIVPLLQKNLRQVQPEVYFPDLRLQDIGHLQEDPSHIVVPDRHTQTRTLSWRYRTLVKHIFTDRLYECSDTELADERGILVLTLGRCREILALGDTFNNDRAVLMALYAAAVQLEADMRADHPSFTSHISGIGVVNRHRIRFYTSALDFFKIHIENLLRAEMPQRA